MALAPLLSLAAILFEAPAATTAAVLSLVVAVAAAWPMDTYDEVFEPAPEWDDRAQGRLWTALQTGGILLDLFLATSAVVLLIAAAHRGGFVDVTQDKGGVSLATIGIMVKVVAVLVISNVAVIHHLALLVPRRRPLSPLRGVIAYAGFAAGFSFAIGGQLAAETPINLAGMVFGPTDGPFLVLGAALMTGLAIRGSRGPPSLGSVLGRESFYYQRRSHKNRRQIFLALALAVAILSMSVLAAIVAVMGLTGTVGVVTADPSFSAIFGLLGTVLLLAMVAAGWFYIRAEDGVELYREPKDTHTRNWRIMIAVTVLSGLLPSITAGFLLAGESVLGLPPFRWPGAIAAAILGFTGPPGLWYARQNRRDREVEDEFPDFLRDLAARHRSGVTLERAIEVARNTDYGALNPEIERMSDQLHWNLSFQETFQRFAERADSALVYRSVGLVEQADQAGGDVAGVLTAAAQDARDVSKLKRERRLNMTMYVAVIYVAFAVFLGVSALMYASFIPPVIEAAGQVESAGGLGGIGGGIQNLETYRAFFFVTATVQAVGSGLIAGVIASGRPTDGLRHIFVMVAMAFIVFTLLV